MVTCYKFSTKLTSLAIIFTNLPRNGKAEAPVIRVIGATVGYCTEQTASGPTRSALESKSCSANPNIPSNNVIVSPTHPV